MIEQQHSGSGDNVARDKVVNIYSSKKYQVPNKLTTKLGEFPNFRGRKKECIELTRKLNKHKVIVVHGIGGIGKSSFVSAYLDIHKNEFKYYGFINWGSDIKVDFFNSLQVNMNLKEYENRDKNFDETIKELRGLDGKKLLIIDKIEEKSIDYKQEEKSIKNILTLVEDDYKIIFVSRLEIRDITSYYLKPLSKKNAKEIFLIYYQTSEMDNLYKVLEYVDYHSLFIKLIAETLQTTDLNIESIIQKFEKRELSKIKFIDEYTMDTVSFNNNLEVLFDIQKINKNGLLLLKQFSALPSINMELSLLKNILEELEEDEDLKNNLNILARHGWLIADKGSYKLHQIIKEYILLYHPPSFKDGDIDKIFAYFFKKIENSANINIAILNKNNLIFFESIHTVIKQSNNIWVALFYMNIGNIYRQLGIYNRAKFFGKLAIRIIHKLIKIDNKDNDMWLHLSKAYNNLSQTYYSLNSFQRTFVLDKKTLSINKKVLGDNHIFTVQSYHNLAQLSFSCGNIKEARNKFEKVIKLIDKLNKIDNHDMYITEKTTLYSNYAIFLSTTQNNHKLAEEYILKAITIYKENYKNIDSNLATFYYHLAKIYENSKNYIKAKKLYEKVLEIKIDTFGEQHNEVATAYMGLSTFYIEFDLNKYCSLSIEYIKKALSIYKDIYKTDKHESIATCYDNLGVIYNRCQKYSNANTYSLKALPLYKELLGNSHYKTLQSYLNVTISFYMMEKYTEALSYAKKIIELKPNCLDDYDTKIILNLSQLPPNSKFEESLITLIGERINKIKI